MTKSEAYRVFGLSMNQPVTLDLIKNRYRILTKTYHPDNPRTGSEEMMAKINLAFDALRTYNFDSEEDVDVRQSHRGTGFDKDFSPDFTPFEYASRDESFYQNNNYSNRNTQNYSSYDRNEYYRNRANGRVRYEEQSEEQPEEYERPKKSRKKKRGGIFILFRMIGRLCKLIILLGIIACFVAAPACLYIFGFNKMGFFLAAASLVMAVLSILVFRFFSELIR